MTDFLLPIHARAYDIVIRYWLRLGVIVLLTGLFWTKDGSQYTKLYYALIAIPALIASLYTPRKLGKILREPIVIAYLALCAWIALSLLWSSTDNNAASLLKRPLYVFMLFVAFTLIALHRKPLLMDTLRIGALLGALATLICLVHYHLTAEPGGRMIGTGALHNPLLTSHLLGFICTYWVASWVSESQRYPFTSLLLAAIVLLGLLATGSRTPLLALLLTSLWLAVISGRRARYLVGLLCLGALTVLAMQPEVLLNRGMSYRPELWSDAISQAQGHLWTGAGYDSKFLFTVSGTALVLSDPHNVELAVLMELGLVGLGIWALMYALAFWRCFEDRKDTSAQITSALLAYGIGAGLTEGGNFLSRPNESWFLVWIPLALCCALSIQRRQV